MHFTAKHMVISKKKYIRFNLQSKTLDVGQNSLNVKEVIKNDDTNVKNSFDHNLVYQRSESKDPNLKPDRRGNASNLESKDINL